MSLEAILGAIEASGEAEVARLRAETESRIHQTLAAAERMAAAKREEARRRALLPVAGERARRLHQARLEALRMTGEVRNRLIEAALAETRQRLTGLRADPTYPLILRRLTEEAIAVLGEEELQGKEGESPSPPTPLPQGERAERRPPAAVLEVDLRDEALLHRILSDLGLVPSTDSELALSATQGHALPVSPALACWGGLVARSGDGRIVVTNTLEARLERATPLLRRELAAFLEAASHQLSAVTQPLMADG